MYRAVDGACPELVPEPIALGNCATATAIRHAPPIFTAKLLRLLDSLKARGSPCGALKGPALAASLYSYPYLAAFFRFWTACPGSRMFPAALRLWREKDTVSAHTWRGSHVHSAASSSLRCFYKRGTGRRQVDLQWAIGLADYPFGFDVEMLWRSLGRSRIAGRGSPQPFAGKPHAVLVRIRRQTLVVASAVAGGRRPAGARATGLGRAWWSLQARPDA